MCNKNIKALAFDLGNVVFSFDYNLALNKIKSKLNVSTEYVIKEMYENNFCLDFEKGLVSETGFYQNFKKAFSASISFEEFSGIWCEIFWPNNKVIELIKALKAYYPLYLISNINILHFKYLEQRYPEIFSLFKSLILSYQVKSVKPEPLIYQVLAETSEADFNQIVYIDDRRDLITEAKKIGLRCIHFKDFDCLINGLESLDIKINR